MKKSFLAYYKMVLVKVRFDKKLFMKEYAKALNTIDPAHHSHFHQWMQKENLKWN